MVAVGVREPFVSWRRACFVLGCFVLLAVLVLVFLVNTILYTPLLPALDTSKPVTPSRYQIFGDPFVDNEAIDGLSDADCEAQFPDLYTDIDRAVNYWKHDLASNITAPETSIDSSSAAMRILIHANELRILEAKHAVDPMKSARSRAEGAINLLQRALDSAIAAGETLPTVEVSMNFQDDAEPDDAHTFWSFARHVSKKEHQRLWLMPNFDFWHYTPTGSFRDAKRNAMQHDAPFASKKQQLVWRGNQAFGPEIREPLLEVTKDKEWADVKSFFEESWLRPDEFCLYAATVYTEGVTYSGRLKFLMNCQSLLFVHEPAYETHYSHLLVAEGDEQNHIRVQRDWTDLEEKVLYYLDRPDEAARIINNMLGTFRGRYTTRAATSCYIRRLIKGYGEVAWTPKTHVEMENGVGWRLRGIPFEEFLHEPEDRNYETGELTDE